MLDAHLLVTTGPLSFVVDLSGCDEEGWLVGSAPECRIVLHGEGIARRHMLLSLHADHWQVENVSRHASICIAGLEQRRGALPEGEEVTLGDHRITLHEAGCTCGIQITPRVGVADVTSVKSQVGAAGERDDLPELARNLAVAVEDWQALSLAVTSVAQHDEVSRVAALVEEEGGQWVAAAQYSGPAARGARPRPSRPHARALDDAFRHMTAVLEVSRKSTLVYLPLSVRGTSGPRAILLASMTPEAAAAGPIVSELERKAWMVAACRAQIARAGSLGTRADRAEASAREAGWTMALFQAGAVSAHVYDRALRAGAAGLPVTLFGEAGTGKELLAAAIHRHSPRSDRPFVRIRCSEKLHQLEASLFGDDGALTRAAGGSLYLDRLERMAPAIQARLADDPAAASLTPIAGVETPLADLVAQGLVVERLARRVGEVEIHIPPLRERPQEVAPLARHLLGLVSPHHAVRIASSTMPILEAHDWPGNLRELKDTLEGASADLRGDLVRPRDLPAHILGAAPIEPVDTPSMTLAEAERQHVSRVLDECGGNVQATARQLGISRARLYRLIDRFGLERRR